MLKLLIIDGNTPETNVRIRQIGGCLQGELFERALLEAGDVHPEILFGADCSVPLPDEDRLAAYDGIAWSGSALNLPEKTLPAMRQVELAKRALLAGAFVYGSCWGLQVAAMACGIAVRSNPRGREIGVARGITLTPQGRRHPLMQGRPERFDALAVHRDILGLQPEPTMTVLASNDLCPVQAAELKLESGRFWGVQYHPEYSLADIASAFRRYGPQLVQEGLFPSLDEAEKTAALYRASGGADEELARQARRILGISHELTQVEFRNQEIRNWLSELRVRNRRTG